MARPIKATPVLKPKDAAAFLAAVADKETVPSRVTVKQMTAQFKEKIKEHGPRW